MLTTVLAFHAPTALPALSRAGVAASPLRAAAVMQASASTLIAPPAAGYEGAVAAGTAKATMAPKKVFTLGVISGCHIAFGAYLMLTVGGARTRPLPRLPRPSP